MSADADLMWETVDREITIALAASYGTIAMITVIVLAALAAAIIVAFVAKRPGGYWMVSGILAFGCELGVQWYVFAHPFLMLNEPLYLEPLLLAVSLLPLFLYSIGLIRLAWSLRRPDESASDQ